MGLELAGAGVEGEVEEKKLRRLSFLPDLLYPQYHAGRCSHNFHFHNFHFLSCCSTHTPEDHSSVASYTMSSEELLGVLGGGEGQDGTEGYRLAVTQVGSAAELHASALGPWGLVRC